MRSTKLIALKQPWTAVSVLFGLISVTQANNYATMIKNCSNSL